MILLGHFFGEGVWLSRVLFGVMGVLSCCLMGCCGCVCWCTWIGNKVENVAVRGGETVNWLGKAPGFVKLGVQCILEGELCGCLSIWIGILCGEDLSCRV